MASRIFRLCIICCVAAALTACGGDNNGDGTNNGTTNNGATNNGTTGTNNGTVAPNNGETNNGANNGAAQCTSASDDCVAGEATNAGFICVDDKCRTECDPNAQPYDCLAGAVCLPVSEGGPSYCQPSECGGYLDFDGCDAGLKCVAAVNDAAICIPEGPGAQGDACDEFGACGGGLICAFGACNTICDADNDCNEAGGERCILDTLGSGVGFCQVGCDSYSMGQCPDGEGCFPVTADDGVCDTAGTVGPYEACTNPEDCGENSACITFQGADAVNGIPQVSRCLPFCNAAADTEAGRNSTCTSAGGNPSGYGRFLHLTEGAGAVDVYVDDALLVDDLAFGANSGAFAALSEGVHKVDIVAGDALDNSAPLLTVNPTIAINDAFTWGIIPDASTTVAVITVDVPRGETAAAAGSSKLRAVHAIPDFGSNADVVAVPAGALDFANETVIATDLALGNAGAFVEVPAASYDIYIFPAGANRTILNPTGVTLSGVAIAANELFSTYARGTVALGDGADLGLTNLAYAMAPTSRTEGLDGFCLDLSNDGVPSPQSGFCLENCPDSDTFGTDACTGPSDYCSALGIGTVCFPGGPNAPGEACNNDNLLDGCNGTGYCEGRGDGSGVCRGYCQPDTQSNSLLGCESVESCIDVGDNIGLCAQNCTGTDFADLSCPEFLQTCLPQERGGDAFCSSSGDIALGGSCDPTAGSCSPGDSCINEFSAGNLAADDPFANGVCAETCDLFGDGTDCGSGQVCAVNWFSLNLAGGHCMTPDEMLQQNQPCAAEFNVCGSASFCLDVGAGAQCLQMCDLDDASTCSAGTCTQLFQSDQIRLGACI